MFINQRKHEQQLGFLFTGGVAGFISESIQGVGGSVPLADGYLPAVYDVRPHPLSLMKELRACL